MPLFKCSKCGNVENTALCDYWTKRFKDGFVALCSECDPNIHQWHGKFQKRAATGYKLGSDGFLYSQEEIDAGQLAWRIQFQEFKIVGDA